MKKLWMGLAAAALAVSLCLTGTLAAGRHGQGLRSGSGICAGSCVNFVDADGDGVCDHYGTGLGIRGGGHHGRGACRAQ